LEFYFRDHISQVIVTIDYERQTTSLLDLFDQHVLARCRVLASGFCLDRYVTSIDASDAIENWRPHPGLHRPMLERQWKRF
jgi:hypothetical protein